MSVGESDSPAGRGRLRRGSPRAVFVTVIVAVFVSNLDLLVVNVALPDIGAGFHGASLDSLSWILNAYAIVFAALLVVAGRLADRSGHREGFLAGLAIFTIGSLLCAVAPNIGFLVAARVVQAVGAALSLPTSLALLLVVTPPAKRSPVVRAWSSVGGAAAALGPVLGGLLVTASWRWVFIINVPTGLAALVLGLRVLPRTPGAGRGAPMPDLAGAGLLTVAIAALSLALVEGDDWGWTTPGPLAGFAVAAVLGAAVVLRSARHPAPVVELPMLRIAQFSLATVAATLFTVGFVAMILSIMLWCQNVWHYSALRTGLAFAPGPLMLPPVVVASGPLVRRVGAGPVAAVGCLVLGGGVLSWALLIGPAPHYATEMLPGAVATGIGVGLALPTLVAAMATSLPPQRFATGSGINTMARQIGAVLGVAVLVSILGRPRSAAAAKTAFDHGWVMVAVASVVAAVAAGLLRKPSGTVAGAPSAMPPAAEPSVEPAPV